MTDTTKYRQFCAEPLDNKLISEVPGVGPMAARKFRKIKYTKASHLFDKLERLKFNEREFRLWIRLNCKGARVSTIFSALLLWHIQFGSNDSRSGRARSREPPMDRPDRTVHARPNGSDQNDDTSCYNETNNPLMKIFLSSFAESFNIISSAFHTELKMEILSVLCKYERKTRERRSGIAPSTARSTNI